MDMLKIVTTVLISLIVCVVIKQMKPEFLPFIQLSAVILVAVMVLDLIKALLSDITAIIAPGGMIESEYIFLLLRVLGLAVVTKLASDICNDNGNSVLADNVELVGKIAIYTLCLPLVKIIAELATGLLE